MNIFCALRLHKWQDEEVVAWQFGRTTRRRCRRCDEALLVHTLFKPETSSWSGV